MNEVDAHPKILVTGSRGVIGEHVVRELLGHGYEVVGTRRNSQAPSEVIDELILTPWMPLDLKSHEVDAIIHLAGEYSNDPSLETQQELFASIVGLAATLSELVRQEGIPLVAIGSYFEKAPGDMSPWSSYSTAKTASRDLLHLASQERSTPLQYIYLYDTYGASTTRGKFLDLLLSKIGQDEPLLTTGGEQVIDLTHVDDVVAGILLGLRAAMTDGSRYEEHQIRFGEAISLRQLANLVEARSKKPINIQWGALPYRQKEVFEIWDCAPGYADFQPNMTVAKFLHSYFAENHDK